MEKTWLNFVVAEIENCAGSQLDPKVVQAFLSLYCDGAFSELKDKVTI